MAIILEIILESWHLLQEAAIYVLFGILIAGLLRIFFSPESVARHLGQGRFSSVLKSALLGIPIPLCSCGVLPAATSLKKQGATNGATIAFLISTPESGVDSMALTYALLDPTMTIARPVAAFTSAATAGITENLLSKEQMTMATPDMSCPVDGCCDGTDCLPQEHRNHHTFPEKLWAGVKYALIDLWGDMASWFLVGLALAGVITTLVPTEMMTRYLGGGLPAMLIMLAAGIPLYICATASTPIAAALILNGVSPGAALVFLLVGPATNITSLTVLFGVLGKRATVIYLTSIAFSAVIFGLALDQIYSILGISAQAVAGQAADWIPHWTQIIGAILLLILSARPIYETIRSRLNKKKDHVHGHACHCSSESSCVV